ncbi:MAG: N-acetyltransferase [Desulfosarcina sp.]|nr:N-acetyltransferase [Desulfosarcina sp.]MBC2742621.1 N-acetyltransferase [Desulfosarcina sp.]MBC2765531.1 N-acetyltransferase [Desulfosarcina sp.]
MKIRESVENDKKSIRKVHQNAFDQSEGETVSQLAIDLLEDKTALPILSLVAEQDNEIIGNIIFSSINIEDVEGVSAYILAPLAVTRFEQKKGIGTLIINKGLETLKERGAEIVLVYGDPNYYMRTGFKSGHNLKPPHKLKYPEEAWMAQELVEGILTKTQGMVKCASSLNSPEYW